MPATLGNRQTTYTQKQDAASRAIVFPPAINVQCQRCRHHEKRQVERTHDHPYEKENNSPSRIICRYRHIKTITSQVCNAQAAKDIKYAYVGSVNRTTASTEPLHRLPTLEAPFGGDLLPSRARLPPSGSAPPAASAAAAAAAQAAACQRPRPCPFRSPLPALLTHY